jgi:hypothetical protein
VTSGVAPVALSTDSLKEPTYERFCPPFY